jgi:hypothetical protein
MILTIDHGAVRELQLNRPPANALSPELIVALRQAVELAPQDGVFSDSCRRRNHWARYRGRYGFAHLL